MVDSTGDERPTEGKKSAKSKLTKAPPRQEDEPVLSGRMVLVVALALAMIIIPTSNLRKYITKVAPETAARAAWKVGEKATLHITVVTSDYDALACADTRRVGDTHCEWQSQKERFPRGEGAVVDDNRLTILQPYRTTDKNLLLAAGLWAQPEVAMRLHNEPPRAVSKNKLARFVASCEVEFLEEWDNSMVRWTPSEPWSNQGKGMVGKIHSCTILEEPRS